MPRHARGRGTLHSIGAITAGETPEYHPFATSPAIPSGAVAVRDNADAAFLLSVRPPRTARSG